MNKISLNGRQWISNQNKDSTEHEIIKVSAIIDDTCSRCNQITDSRLPNGKLYCRSCLILGRISEEDFLVKNRSTYNFSTGFNGGLSWNGKLTCSQARVAKELCKSFEQEKDHLVHAVTGAGKTEMLFPVIARCLEVGKRVAIATPRIDVVNELYPRFSKAFPTIKIGKYHGQEYHEPENEQFVICTTHQLLKYYHAFDLLIIDEVDAFPFFEDPMLYFGADTAVKEIGSKIFLTATPDKKILKKAKCGKINYSLLKRRFHGGLLPVPQESHFILPFLKKEKINYKLLKQIKNIVITDKPLLIFVPSIKELKKYKVALKKEFEEKNITSVHANDENRHEKVLNFRNNNYDILLTTTILERGVTFKNVQVIVIEADNYIYNTQSLVQIAGRVGRNKENPNGIIVFCYHKYTKDIRHAMKQIRSMNK